MLKVQRICSGYGRIQVLHDIDLDVEEGEVVSLIGANGAGKTTLLMTICGNPRARTGRILLSGKDITTSPTFQIARSGLAHAPEGRHIFSRLTVLENLQMGAARQPQSFFSSDLEQVLALFPRLGERLYQRGGTLSGGEQQMLAIGRALMSRPRLLLLDEPSLGLAPIISRQLFAAIRDINRTTNMSILLVEQHAFQALRLAHRAHIMRNGRIELSGTGTELLNNPAVQTAYLEGIARNPAESV